MQGLDVFNISSLWILREIAQNQVFSAADGDCWLGKKTSQTTETYPNTGVTGFGFSHLTISVALAHYSNVKNLCFRNEDITKKAYDQKFDLVAMFDVLEHIEDREGSLEALVNANG